MESLVAAWLPWVGLVGLGALVGTLGTLIGAGGGFVLVPVLLLLYPDEPVQTITAISLAVVAANAISGSIAYARLGRIDYRTGTIFAVASMPGAILGSLATGFVPRGVFDAVFGLVLVGLAVYLLLRGRVQEGHAVPKRVNLLLGGAISFGVGFLSSVLGIGGGVIHVPLLIQFLDYPAHIATATSHFILAIMALTGTVTHLASGELVHGARRATALAFGVVVGAQAGAWLSQRVHGRLILRSLAVGLLGVGVRLMAKIVPALVLVATQAGALLALVDRQAIQTHALAMPRSSAVGVAASVSGLVVGEALLWMMFARRRAATRRDAARREPPAQSGP